MTPVLLQVAFDAVLDLPLAPVLDVVGSVLILGGALLFATAGLGLVRLKDVYARSSAIATAAGMGVSLMLLGVLAHLPSWTNLVKVALAVALQLITSAVGSMAIARAGYLTGSPIHNPSGINELASAESDDNS